MKRHQRNPLQLKRQRLSVKNASTWLSAAIALALIYYVVGKLGMMVALPIPPGNITAVWFPSAIAWVAMLWRGYNLIPAIWIADFWANTPAYLDTSHDLLKSIAVGCVAASGAVVEAGLGSVLLRRIMPIAAPFTKAQSVLKFILIAALCPALNATMGVTAICSSGISAWTDFGFSWLTWWTGNTISVLVFAPMLIIWRQLPHINWQPRKWGEACLLCVLLLAIGQLSFAQDYPVQYLMLPCLWWAAFRFGRHGATLASVFVSSLALWGTINGTSSFMRQSLNESLVLLQTFMGVVAVSTLLFSAIINEQNQAEAALEEANKTLELRVQERTNALTETNEKLQIEIVERQEAELLLRQSEAEKTQLIASLRSQTLTLEQALRDLSATQAQLIQTEKMSSLGQLVAGVAHEINNPISFIYSNIDHAKQYAQGLLALIDLYQRGYSSKHPQVQQLTEAIELDFLLEDLPKLLNSMKVGAQRIREIVLILRNFSRLDEAEMKPVNLHEGIDSTLILLQTQLKPSGDCSEIQVVKHYGILPDVECYPGQLNQVFMNILSNAIDALRSRTSQTHAIIPVITIKTEVVDDQWVSICVQDNGVGIQQEVRDRIFDPFFTTKAVGKGTGLGLSISYQIVVDKHGGRLKCVSEPGQGTEFWIQIPMRRDLLKKVIKI